MRHRQRHQPASGHQRGRDWRAQEFGGDAKADKANRTHADANGKQAQDAAAQLHRRCQINKRRLHDAETRTADAYQN